jgi:transposase-like protein
VVEQDHRFTKRLVKPGMGFFSLETAGRTLQGYEIMHMIGKVPSLPASLDWQPKRNNKGYLLPIVFL